MACRLAHAVTKAKSEGVAHVVHYNPTPFLIEVSGGRGMQDPYRLTGIKQGLGVQSRAFLCKFGLWLGCIQVIARSDVNQLPGVFPQMGIVHSLPQCYLGLLV